MDSILERYADQTLKELFTDEPQVSIYDPKLAWLELPPKGFLDYVTSLEPTPYDGTLTDSRYYRNSPSFLISQVHRIWLSVRKLSQFLPTNNDAVILDLGAYPFVIDTAIRRYLRRALRIIGTTNVNLSPEALVCVDRERIELLPVNLDPLVNEGTALAGMKNHIPLDDDTVDFVIFAHVIEHLYHPIDVLKEAQRVLKPSGAMFLTTDNAFMIQGLLHYLMSGDYLHEPVSGTAAMTFHEWRGHVRFFSVADLKELLASAKLTVTDCELREVIYGSLLEDYFVQPVRTFPRWKARLLSDFPYLRNEILLIATKPGA